jgi:amidohydrolase
MPRWLVLLLFAPLGAYAASPDSLAPANLEAVAARLDASVIAWRRDIHAHPELSNRETRTAALVARHLESLGLEVHTGIAHTGVAAVLRGGRPGPTVALRADMDALPVTEETDVPFRSTATAEYRDQTVGVMHACGHDGHTAILMGVAAALAEIRSALPGSVLFVFQPAEEGAPPGERGGASLMLEEGVFELTKSKPAAAFGLHLFAQVPVGTIGYRKGPFMAASDRLRILVTGRQTHGSRPWDGVDPIVTAAQIITGLQTIVSRETDITKLPAVVSIGSIEGGIRFNIIPDTVEMWGTMRTFDPDMRSAIIDRIERKVQHIAAANDATAEVEVGEQPNPVTYNDPQLTERMLPTLERVAGPDRVRELSLQTTAEDFSYYARSVPSLFFWVGVTPPDRAGSAAPNHSPRFYLDEAALAVGMRALTNLAVDYLSQSAAE